MTPLRAAQISWVRLFVLLLVVSGGAFVATRGASAAQPGGSLLRMDMRSTVGVLLDEIPAGPLREATARRVLARDASFWLERAANQVRLTSYRLVFRGGFYFPDTTKGPLPLPPKTIWNIHLDGKPRRHSLGGHDVVLVDYSFRTHLLSDPASPGNVEPRLAQIGGTWDEPFELPVDPELLLQRTGFACMDEAEFPPNSVFEENTWYFYDQTCDVETPATSMCHVTTFPSESCLQALRAHVGLVSTAMRFTRVPYSASLAGRVRVGRTTNPDGADLVVVTEDMARESRILYRYFTPDSCEIDEGVVGAPGWRRLLTFSANVRNDGAAAIDIGDVTDPANPWVQARVFEFSACHHHYHFSHYANFSYAGAPGLKRAFCLEDTNRFHNDETTPLTADHQSCAFQGVSAGWGDEYQFGLPGQWVDITGVDTTAPHDLVFDVNPDRFLCEGTPVLDAGGNPIFDPTEFTDAAGNVVSRIRCAFPTNWDANNVGRVSVSSPGGSFVTEACRRGQIGPLRDCGFTAQPPLQACPLGQTVTLRNPTGAPPRVVRVCEVSEKLGVGVACTFREAVANSIVGGGTTLSFPCPAVRDAAVTGTGGYSVYHAPVAPLPPEADEPN
ncbi:MAG: hypothetical protein HY294_00325 [Candidatus Rokubacteria bacterium]|nr:hypothetical protein [Candidatus Rokubacteria bacterium]